MEVLEKVPTLVDSYKWLSSMKVKENYEYVAL